MSGGPSPARKIRVFRPRTLIVSSLQFAISNSGLKCCQSTQFIIPVETGIQVSCELKNSTWMPAFAGMTHSLQLFAAHPFAAGASTLISRSFGMTFRQIASCSSPCTREARYRRRNLQSSSRILLSSHNLRAAVGLFPGFRLHVSGFIHLFQVDKFPWPRLEPPLHHAHDARKIDVCPGGMACCASRFKRLRA